MRRLPLSGSISKLSLNPSMEERIELSLYIHGEGSRTARVLSQLQSIMENSFAGKYDIAVVDLEKYPKRAEEERIMVVPTVIKTRPLPRQRIVGSLAVAHDVIRALDLELLE